MLFMVLDEFVMDTPKEKKSEPKQVRMAPEALTPDSEASEEDDATVEVSGGGSLVGVLY